MVLTNESNVALIDLEVANLPEHTVVVGIPAFNEEKTIARVVLGAQKHVHVVVGCYAGSSDMTDESAERLIPEEEVTSEELRELKAFKKEALSGECVSFEDVLKKHGEV